MALDKLMDFAIRCDNCKLYYADKETHEGIPLASEYCAECTQPLCSRCIQFHRTNELKKQHEIVPIEDQVRKQILELKESPKCATLVHLCSKCNEILCEECSLICTKHMSSEIQDIVTPEGKFDRHNLDSNSDHQMTESKQKAERILVESNVETQSDVKTTKETISTTVNLEEMTLACDVCAEDNDNEDNNLVIATKRCIDCAENQCDQCSKEHKRQRASKSHKIVALDDKMKHKLKEMNYTKESQQSTKPCDQRELTDQQENSVSEISQEVKESSSNNLSVLASIRDSQLINLLNETNYSRIGPVIEMPIVSTCDLQDFWIKVLPYLTQRIKMWNCDVLSPQKLNALVELQKKSRSSDCQFHGDSSNPKSPDVKQKQNSNKPICPVSRLDCLAIFLNTADAFVAEDILRIKSKFPMTLPLIIPDIDKTGQYIVTIPYFHNIVIRWESNPGQIAENRLFTNPFSMVVALRLGNNKTGKSTILNQLMRKQYMFSSRGEPGAKYGRPLTLDGSVEMLWLTQETCSDITWKTTMSEFYKENREDVALLANLHGDALRHPEIIEFLATYAQSFIVFIMPGASAEQSLHLQRLVSSKSVHAVLVDPEYNETESDAVFTDELASDETLQTVRKLLHEAFGRRAHKISHSVDAPLTAIGGRLRFAHWFCCEKSDKIINIVKENSCLKVKGFLSGIDFEKTLKLMKILKDLYDLVSSIVSKPSKDAKQSLAYLETNLSQISTNESLKIRQEARKASDKIQHIKKSFKNLTKGESGYQQELQNAEKELLEAMDKIDSINLGQEHLYRMLGQFYEYSITTIDLGDLPRIKDLPSHLADLLISGHAIEILNGDAGEVQRIWIKAIFNNVSKKCPAHRIFVISIIGLQSSGKSTLLNALFSCKFAVSVGRCTRGLFMRMVFLDEELRESHGFDCIVLIDTEGLCSTEKMNDPKAKQKDRLMATFAMGISNLTLVNILGEGMAEMTEILQIATVAMARLKSGKIKPNILVVQHLQERNLERVDQAIEQFRKAINNAFVLIDKNDVEIGSTSEECLTELMKQIQSGELFKHFGAFRDGSSVNSPPSEAYHDDVVDLYKKVLERAKTCNTKCSFERWSDLFESFWQCVQEETFVLNFINVKHITDHLYFMKKTEKVKMLNGWAIRRHRDIFIQHIEAKIASMMKESDDRKFRSDDIRVKIIGLVSQKMESIPHRCVGYETEENGQGVAEQCNVCKEFQAESINLLKEIEGTEWEEMLKHSLEEHNMNLHRMATMMLEQSFDASAIKQECFSKFIDLIEKELNEALQKRPSGKYTKDEQQIIAKNIWELLQDIAGTKETGADLRSRMASVLHREYVQTGIVPDMPRNLINRPIKFVRSLFRKVTGVINRDVCEISDMDDHQIQSLKQKLDGIVEEVLKSRGDEYERTGLDFDEGMVSELKEKFPTAVKLFESTFDLSLKDSFKNEMLIYTLQQLEVKMDNLQKVWDTQNKPSAILESKKEEYMKRITIRLKTEFSYTGAAKNAAAELFRAIKKNAVKSVRRAKIEAVKKASWTASTQSVRLRYFAKLAEEVDDGKKKRALKHFDDPKTSIVSWFKDEVESLITQTELMETYRSTLTGEFERITQSSNSSNNANVKDPIKKCYDKIKLKDGDFQIFRSHILSNLDKLFNSAMTEDVTFSSAYDASDVKDILGCTERCPWCGAICWGSVNHASDASHTISLHYSCHQPTGLSGYTYWFSSKLNGNSCYPGADFDLSRLLNKIFKTSKWKEDPHYVKEFDQLMSWFFKELHEDIAGNKKVKPADKDDLNTRGYLNLNLKTILTVVYSKI